MADTVSKKRKLPSACFEEVGKRRIFVSLTCNMSLEGVIQKFTFCILMSLKNQ